MNNLKDKTEQTESKIRMKDLIKEERAKTFDLFLKNDLMQHGYNVDKILGGHKWGEKFLDAVIKWDSYFTKTKKYKEGDIERFVRKAIGDPKTDKLKRLWQ